MGEKKTMGYIFIDGWVFLNRFSEYKQFGWK